MQISVLGRTDKRPCIYTLMKMLQPMGDVIVITNNGLFSRLIEDGSVFGYYQNIAVYITDESVDEVWYHDELDEDDYDFIVLDGQYNDSSDVILYVQGAGVEVLDEDVLYALSDSISTIFMGKGKGKTVIPYSKDLMKNIEHIEYYRQLVAPSNAAAQVMSTIMAPHLNMPVKNLMKVVTTK